MVKLKTFTVKQAQIFEGEFNEWASAMEGLFVSNAVFGQGRSGSLVLGVFYEAVEPVQPEVVEQQSLTPEEIEDEEEDLGETEDAGNDNIGNRADDRGDVNGNK